MHRIITDNLCPNIIDIFERVLKQMEKRGEDGSTDLWRSLTRGNEDTRILITERYRKDGSNEHYLHLKTENNVWQALRRRKNTALGPERVQY